MKVFAAAALLAALSAPALAQNLPVLRLGIDSDADALDPTLSRTYVGRIVFASLCDKLVDIDAKLNIVPQLAEKFEWADPKTLVLHLRAGVVFQDGTKLDGEAVKFSLMRHATMEGSTRKAELSAMESVEVVDPLTVKVHLKAANAPFLSQLADRSGMIVSPTAAQKLGKDFQTHPVCAGPFSFTERVAQDHITLDRFAGYWNKDAIHLSRVVVHPIPDNTVRLANLRAGALDFAEGMQPTDVEAMRKDPKLKVLVFGNLGYQGITFNIANGTRARTPMMSDARVRQAFALSIDRKALIDVVYAGLYTPVAQPVPPESPFYAPEIAVEGRDVAKAKALLKEAGVKTPVTVELLTSNSPDQKQTGEVIQSMAAEAGFDVKIRSTEFVTALKASDDGDFEAFPVGWSGRVDEDGNIYSFLKTGAPLNASKYSNPEVDSLLEQARAVTDIAARRAVYAKIGAISNRDLPVMYLYSPKAIFAMSAKVSGFVPVPDDLVRPQGVVIAP